MKKTYMIPKLETIEVKTAGMLALSRGKGDGYIDPSEMGAPSMTWDDEYDEE